MKAQYADLRANPNLHRLINDNRAALTHLGLYLGFLGFELGRRDWRGVTLILTVGLLNGLGWALCQNWHWAPGIWPDASFNWWRGWESSGGISIGIAYGLAYYLANRRCGANKGAVEPPVLVHRSPNLERLGAYLGLLLGLGLSLRNGMKGWANIYLGNERYWNHVLWAIIGPMLLAGLVALLVWIWASRLPEGFPGDVFPHSYRLLWLVLLTQNVIAQLITGPLSVWNEMVFNIYYLLLFLVSAVIVIHFEWLKRSGTPAAPFQNQRFPSRSEADIEYKQ
jgi:hypothetical protein